MAGLTLRVSPEQLVPAVLVLEVLAGLSRLRKAAKSTGWKWLSWLIARNLL